MRRTVFIYKVSRYCVFQKKLFHFKLSNMFFFISKQLSVVILNQFISTFYWWRKFIWFNCWPYTPGSCDTSDSQVKLLCSDDGCLVSLEKAGLPVRLLEGSVQSWKWGWFLRLNTAIIYPHEPKWFVAIWIN